MATPRVECVAEQYQQTNRLTVASGAEERDIVIVNAGLKLLILPMRGRNRIGNSGDITIGGGRTRIMNNTKTPMIRKMLEMMPDTVAAIEHLRESRGYTFTGQLEYLLRTHPDMQRLAVRAGIEWESRNGRGRPRKGEDE